MNSTITKILSALSFLLMGVSVVLVILFYAKNAQVTAGEGEFALIIEQLGPALEYFIIWTYFLLGVAVIASILFPILNIFSNPKGAVKSLIGVVIFVVVILISWAMADDTVLYMPSYEGDGNVPGTLKFAGMALITMYIMLVAAIASILATEVAKIFK